jgi:Lrp/AsnC family leucine-responsive transcriptional regulator
MAPSAILERIRKLEQKEIVRGYEARLDPGQLGLGLTAFIYVRGEERPFTGKTGQALAAIPEAQEVHNIAGEDCFLVKVKARDTADLTRILREGIASIKGITGTRTTIVLETLKETGTLPLSQPRGESGNEGKRS